MTGNDTLRMVHRHSVDARREHVANALARPDSPGSGAKLAGTQHLIAGLRSRLTPGMVAAGESAPQGSPRPARGD